MPTSIRVSLSACLLFVFASTLHASNIVTVSDLMVETKAKADFFLPPDDFESIAGYYRDSLPTDPAPVVVESRGRRVGRESYTKNVLKWSNTDAQLMMSFDLDHKTSGMSGSNALSYFGIRFIANEDAIYELSGVYTAAAETPDDKYLVVYAELGEYFEEYYGWYDGGILFHRNRVHTLTGNSYTMWLGDTLDQIEPDEFSNPTPATGNLTGRLVAGHYYGFDFVNAVYFNSFYDSPVHPITAVGNLTLRITRIPEPSTVALCSVFAALGLIRRRQIA